MHNDEPFIRTLPAMFATEMQKATLSTFLWNKQDSQTIVENLRLYDLVRRMYYVKLGIEPLPERVIELMEFVRSIPVLRDVFMSFVNDGAFPDVGTIMYIKNNVV